MRINTSIISFRANIRFCSPEEFEQYKPSNYQKEYPVDNDAFLDQQRAYHDVHPNESSWPWNIQSVRNEPDIATGKIFTCSAGGVTGLDDHSVATRYHLVPELENICSIRDENSQLNSKLRNKISQIDDRNLCAFLVGGDVTTAGLKDDSRRLFDVIINFFKKQNIDASYFWGQSLLQDKRGVDAYYTAKDDTWRVLKYKLGSNHVVSSLEELKKAFVQTHLGKNDKLYFALTKNPILPSEFNAKITFKGRCLEMAA